MIWINGYTSKWSAFLKLKSEGGKAYWGKSIQDAGVMLRDWSHVFIDPKSPLFSTALSRFRSGYEFGARNYGWLRSYSRLAGHHLHIISHGHGLAFAEGLAAYLFEEKGVRTSVLIGLEGSQLKHVPQSRSAVETRLCLATGKNSEKAPKSFLRFCHIAVIQSPLKSGFIKYALRFLGESFQPYCLYKKGRTGMFQKITSRLRPDFESWPIIKQALRLYLQRQETEIAGLKDYRSQIIRNQFISQN
jgi:hypothetical protein